jgi:hypothetical protein
LAIGKLRGTQALAKQIADDRVGACFHAAIGVVDNEPFARTEQLYVATRSAGVPACTACHDIFAPTV